MRLEGFGARSDVVGRRVRISWTVALEPGEQVSAIPPVRLRRKERDVEFPTPDDSFVVYASDAFPPPGTQTTEIDLGGRLLPDGGRVATLAESVARPGAVHPDRPADRPTELGRRTRTTTLRPDGSVAARTDEVLDAGPDGAGLTPRTAYYYELVVGDGIDVPGWVSRRPQAIARPTAGYASGRALYEQLPTVYRRHDVVTGPGQRAFPAVPEAAQGTGQLRRLLDVFGAGLDHLRSRAEGLLDLRDVENVDARMLPHLAAWLGWNLSVDLPIPLQRHEIRYAAQLYRITGTLPGCTLWAKRLTGWDVQVREMWRNVLVTNDLGNPGDPNDRGSRSVDTADAGLLARLGTVDDGCDYSYDASPDGLHAFPVVAFYATPGADEPVQEVLARRGRLLAGTSFFLPFTMRAAMVLAVPTDEGGQSTSLGLTATTDQGV